VPSLAAVRQQVVVPTGGAADATAATLQLGLAGVDQHLGDDGVHGCSLGWSAGPGGPPSMLMTVVV
jgi:hypothetical protein